MEHFSAAGRRGGEAAKNAHHFFEHGSLVQVVITTHYLGVEGWRGGYRQAQNRHDVEGVEGTALVPL